MHVWSALFRSTYHCPTVGVSAEPTGRGGPSWWKHEEAISRLKAPLAGMGVPSPRRLHRNERLVEAHQIRVLRFRLWLYIAGFRG